MPDPTGQNSVLVLPTYNEAENLESLIRTIRHNCPSLFILIVDDDSPDGTGVIADQLASELSNIELIHRHGERGLGSAYRAGFAAIAGRNFDAVITMDADFSHDPTVLPQMLTSLQTGVGVVIGSRYVDGGDIKGWPLSRKFLSRWGNVYTRWVLQLNVRDCTSGFRTYTSEALATINPSLEHGEGYVSLTALLRRAQQHQLTMVEIPIIYTNRTRGASKMSWRIVLESMFLVTILGIRDLQRRIGKKIRLRR